MRSELQQQSTSAQHVRGHSDVGRSGREEHVVDLAAQLTRPVHRVATGSCRRRRRVVAAPTPPATGTGNAAAAVGDVTRTRRRRLRRRRAAVT